MRHFMHATHAPKLDHTFQAGFAKNELLLQAQFTKQEKNVLKHFPGWYPCNLVFLLVVTLLDRHFES